MHVQGEHLQAHLSCGARRGVQQRRRVTPPAAGNYNATAGTRDLDITLTFNEAVTVVTSGGTPSIPLTIGGAVRQATYNAGASSGNNLVFRTTKSKYVVLLNQDAYAQRNWVTELVRAAEMDERIGSVGSKMLFFRCPTLLNSTAIEINEAGWGWDRQVGERDENPSPMPEEVFGGCGGAVFCCGHCGGGAI